MIGTMITFNNIPIKFTQFIKNIRIGAVQRLAQIVGTKYSFQNLQSKKSDFSFLFHFFFSFLFSTKFWENFWNKTIHVIAQKLRINPISYHKLNGLKIRIAMNAYIIALRIEISLPRNSAINVKLHITAALKTLASFQHINA